MSGDVFAAASTSMCVHVFAAFDVLRTTFAAGVRSELVAVKILYEYAVYFGVVALINSKRSSSCA